MRNTTIFIILLVILAVGLVAYVKLGHKDMGHDHLPEEQNEQNEPGSGDINLEFPESINTQYIQATDWPPETRIVDDPYECNEAGTEIDRAGATEEKTINGRNYCVTTVAEGAAGSIYRQYAYGLPYNDGTAFLTFSLRFPQCGNYDEPERAACQTEQDTFDVDVFIDNILYQDASTLEADRSAADEVFTFNCDNGAFFTIMYSGEDNQNATLSFSGVRHELSRAISGSGARYTSADESVVFWEHGGEAQVEIDGETVVSHCAV